LTGSVLKVWCAILGARNSDVERPEMWDSVGLALFERVSDEAKKKGAVGSVVICAHRDEIERHFLDRLGMRIVSEWHMKRW
jgi:hypothetical protein